MTPPPSACLLRFLNQLDAVQPRESGGKGQIVDSEGRRTEMDPKIEHQPQEGSMWASQTSVDVAVDDEWPAGSLQVQEHPAPPLGQFEAPGTGVRTQPQHRIGASCNMDDLDTQEHTWDAFGENWGRNIDMFPRIHH